MSVKEIEVTCPCCSTTLTVDVLTAKVMRTSTPQSETESGKGQKWDSAQSRVRERTSDQDARLDAALSNEKERRRSFDDLFDEAQDKANKKPDWDED